MICFKAADLDTGASSDTSIINEMTCGEKTKLFFAKGCGGAMPCCANKVNFHVYQTYIVIVYI